MQSDTLHVRHVRGRYPNRGVLRSGNIESCVTEVARSTASASTTWRTPKRGWN